MENSNRPIQRVVPIRSEFQNRPDSNFNSPNSSSINDVSCDGNAQHFKIINSSNDFGNVIESLPFVQQNVNIMNINLSNNGLLQGVSQDPSNSFSQPNITPKTFLQLSDGRYVQIAQNIQPAQHQMPTTILLQMPYNTLSQPNTNLNQGMMNKRFLLPSKVNDRSPQNNRFITIGNPVNNCNNMLIPNQQSDLYAKVDSQIKQMEIQTQPLNEYQRNMMSQLKDVKDQFNNSPGESKLAQNVNANSNIISLDKYQEVCDMLHDKKLLTKSTLNEETVLVEFRLNQQKYQLRMTRSQKVDMEKLLISAGNQQRQMEILQVYQSEQRKNMQQRTSVVLNQIINKGAANIVCNSPQIQTLNLAKPMYPLNSVLVAVSQNQFNDQSLMHTSIAGNDNKCQSVPSTLTLQNPNGVILTTRLPSTQSSIISLPSVSRDPNKDVAKQKRVTKVPIVNYQQALPNLSSNQDMKPARCRRFNNTRKVLLDDQSSVTTPDCRQPFEDLNDVARRLVPYHIMEECKDQRFDEVDRILDTVFADLNKRCTNLKRIASSIAMKDLLEDREHILVKRMQLDLERDSLARERVAARTSAAPQAIDNAVIVIEDSPPSAAEVDLGDPDTVAMAAVDPPLTTDSALATVPGDEDRAPLLDSLCALYDIEDISDDDHLDDGDGEDDEVDHIDDIEADNDDDADDDHLDDHLPQSADPDLDAAIKSILF